MTFLIISKYSNSTVSIGFCNLLGALYFYRSYIHMTLCYWMAMSKYMYIHIMRLMRLAIGQPRQPCKAQLCTQHPLTRGICLTVSTILQ